MNYTYKKNKSKVYKTQKPAKTVKFKKWNVPKVQKQKDTVKRRSGKVPVGRTLSTYDTYLPHKGEKDSDVTPKKRPVVVIETNDYNELAVVPLSHSKGKNRTRLKKYQDGSSYFKHYVEIEDNEGKPIVVGQKFRENHKNQDVSSNDVDKIRCQVFYHSLPKKQNNEKIIKFRKKKKPDK